MKRNLQVASGILSLLLLVEVSSYALKYPPSFLRRLLGTLPAATTLSGSQLTCVSTDPSQDITPSPAQPSPPPTPAPPVAGGGTIHISAVAAGCAVPNMNSQSVFYVDAVNGSDTGDGSQAHPWKNLQTVITKDVAATSYVTPYSNPDNSLANGGKTKPLNPTGPIKSGSIIYLMNGNYGDILVNAVNSDFIAIVAAPGQTPVIHSLKVQASSKWIFQGLKIQALADSYNAGVNISINGFSGPVDNILFDHNSVSSADDSSNWSQADWVAKARFRGIYTDNGGIPGGASCLTITNNNIFNVKFGSSIVAENTLYSGNTINDFGDDGIDFQGNNLVLSYNVITNNHDMGDGNHEDGMQGQIGRSLSNTNVTIDHNKIIRDTTPSLKFPTYLQGISAFDGDWTNLTVTNNTVITNIYHGMSFSSVHGGLIANNTVLNDGTTIGADQGDTMIDINDKTHEGSITNDLVVKDNIATELLISTVGVTTASHNIAQKKLALFEKGATVYYSKAGTYGDANILDPNLNTYFVNFNPTSFQFNVQVSGSTPASGLGAM